MATSNPYAMENLPPVAANDSAPAANPYSLKVIEADETTRLRGSLLSAQAANPDQTAEAVKLSRTTGSPYEAIQANLPEVQQGQRLDDYEKMLNGTPATRKFLTRPQNAAMANDDVGTLTSIEKAIRGFIRGGPDKIQRAPSSVMGSREFSEAVRLAKENNPALDDDAARALAAQGVTFDNTGSRIGPVRGPEPTAGNIASGVLGAGFAGFDQMRQGVSMQLDDLFGFKTDAGRKFAQAQGRESAATPEFETSTGRGLFGGAVSTLQALPGMAAAVAGGVPAGLAMAGLQTQTQTYGKYRTRGASAAEALGGSAAEGAIEVATEMLPMSFMVNKLGKSGFNEFFKGMLAREIPGEQLATLAQDAVDTAIANPDKTWAQYIAERPDAAYQTLLATVVQGGALGAVNTIAAKASGFDAQATRAEEAAVTAESLTKLAEASKLRARDPESFAEFVNQVAEDTDTPTELFIDAEVLTNTLNQAGITMERLAMVAPAVAAQLRASSFVPGADVRVPVAEFAAAGPEITTPLIDHLRESPDAMSRAEAKQYLKTEGDAIRADVEKELGKFTDRQAYQQSIDTVAKKFEVELNAASKFRPEVNKAYATMLGNFYAAQAARAGITPEEFMDRYQLRVTGKDVKGAQTLEQAGDTVPGALLELGKLESTFQSPKSAATDLAAIAADKGGAVSVAQETVTQPDNTERPTGNWTLTLPDGEQGFMTQRDGTIYLNVAGLKEGGGGNAIYDLAANYALNNGLKFIGDPAGLSHAAMRRRLENMLSSAVKYGTTDHLQPHPDQLKGNAKIGVPPLKWTEGDTAGNILSMVEASVAATANTNPVATQNVRFDAETQSFVDGDNNPLDAADLRALLDFDERTPGTGQAGVATLQRNALYRALLSGPDARRAFLGAVRGQPGEPGAGTGATRGTFYQGVAPGGRPDGAAKLHFARDITQAPSVIALLEGADLTSFVHESGHFFLEVQADLAARIASRIAAGGEVTEAERGILEDMNTLLAWFGVTDTPERSALDEWAGRTLEERREAHETFARGFERYAMEGKAPSQELQGLFSKFRSWLLAVYKQLKALNVNLTDDVRAVMDRMLATNEAIQDAEAARNMGPLFQSPEQAGMTAKEYDAYQFLGERATAAAGEELDARLLKDMKWLSRAKDKAIKAAQAEADDIRRDTEIEVRREVMSEDIYRAWAFLTGKLDPIAPGTVAPEDITGMESGKLRTSVVKDIDPEAWSRLSERRMTSEDRGLHPDIVADVFGFSSGDELVRKLAAVPPPAQVIADMVDDRMMERYGDITSAEALNRAADEAVHNELRARVIATELKALQKAGQVLTGERNTVNVVARAAKEFAAQIVARQRVRDLRPSQYTAAEARSARLAEQALGKDIAAAALHKRNQLINNYAAKAAYDAQDEVKAMQAYFRKFDKRRDSIDASYQDQIEQLLENFDFKPVSLKEVDKRKSFAAWYEEQAKGDNPPDVPDYLLQEAGRKSYKDMTVEELRGLRDTVKQIEHLGRLKNKLLLARDKRDFDAAATGLANSIIEHGGEARPEQLEGPNPVVDWFAGVAASHRKLASLFRQMDGNKDSGPMYDLIGRGMNERGTMEDVMVEKATESLRAIYAPLLKMKGGITGYRSKVFIPELVRPGETDAEAKKKYSMTRGGRLAVALNWGNEANRQRIMDGDKWTAGQVQAILKTLSPAELKFVNDIWAYIDSYWPEIAAKEKRLTGVEPEKVEALPFVQTASDGTEVQMKGGYYPLKYDTDRSDRADTQEAAQAAKEMMQGVMTKATTRRGHTKERLKEVKRAVRKDLNVITQHVTQVAHDLAWHEWLIDTNKLLSDARVVSAIRDHYGPKVLKSMRDDVMGIATADVVPQTDVDKALLALRGNVTRATMGASLTTAFLQPFGLTQSIVRIGPRHVLRGLARWGGDAARMENTVEWIRGKSEFMRLRSKTFNKELREIRGSVAGKSPAMRMVDAGLFALMQKMQLVADVPTWVGQYEKSIAEGLDEDAAVAMADRAVLESQGGGATKDLAEVQRKHPMLVQFYSYFSVTLNLAAEQTAATNFKNPAAVAGWLGDMALLMVIPAILPSMILFALKGGGGDDDEKAMAKRIAEWQLGYLMSTVVGLREFSGMVSGFDYAGPPVGRIVGDTVKAGKQTAQGEIDDPLVLSYINLAGTAFGLPVVQMIRSYKGWKAWDEGQDGAGPQSVLFGPPPKN